MKKVILILIDALMPEALENAITTGKTPALKFLMDNGIYQNECVTGFPTMTASVDATLMTGVYPDKHKIPGLLWYNEQEKRIIDYVNGTKTVLTLGINKTAKDVLINLNEKHMNKQIKTVFEELENHGKTAASINFIIHRGTNKHQLNLPFLLNLATKFSLNKKFIKGPRILSIGAMCKPNLQGRKIFWSLNQTAFQHFGVNDDFAAQVTTDIINSGNQPDLMMIYFPNHDHYLHKNIDQPLISLEKVDKKIVQILNTFDSWEKAIEQNIFIIIGDHGQTKIGQTVEHNIDLDKLLSNFKVVQVGKKITEEDEIVIANNERMIYVYPLQKKKRQAILADLLSDPRIDFIAWKQDGKAFVKNHKGKSLSFAKNGKFQDDYGYKWEVEGDLKLLDITISNDKQITYNEYPDALSRLYGALFSQETFAFIATAKPSFEFISKTFPSHLGGGSHGSLHKIDSVVPLLITGATNKPEKRIRIVDLKNYILQLFNITSTTTG